MTNKNCAIDRIKIIQTDIKEIEDIIELHTRSLTYPMESWLEDTLLGSVIYKIMHENHCIGYAGLNDQTMQFFHVIKEFFCYAPVILEKIVAEKNIQRHLIMSQDSLLNALIAEWDYERRKSAASLQIAEGLVIKLLELTMLFSELLLKMI